MFDCDACELRLRTVALDPVNTDAWAVYTALGGRSVQALGLGPYLIEALTEGLCGEARADLVARLDLIFSVLAPPAQPDGDTQDQN